MASGAEDARRVGSVIEVGPAAPLRRAGVPFSPARLFPFGKGDTAVRARVPRVDAFNREESTALIEIAPVILEGHGVRLEPLETAHAPHLAEASRDGELWRLWFTSVPEPAEAAAYVAAALEGQRAGHMLPWAVRELTERIDQMLSLSSHERTAMSLACVATAAQFPVERNARETLAVLEEALRDKVRV